MRTNIVCQECSKANNNFAVFYVDTIREDGVYIGKCPKGHVNAVATQTLRHEMLFDIALNAIHDHYHREAVSSFAASVERYCEFAIRVLAKHRGIAPDVFGKAWNQIAVQSERQLGGYVMLYTLSFGETPAYYEPSMVKLRNDVIHKGVLPNLADTVKFGGASYQIIQKGIQKLRANCLESVNQQMTENLQNNITKFKGEWPKTTQVTPTALNVIEDISAGYRPFQQILQAYKISSS